jgi:hypothetical protein
LGVRSNSTPINHKKFLTEPIGPPYIELANLDFEILILNSIELLRITITLQVRYTRCYIHSRGDTYFDRIQNFLVIF